MWYNFLLGISYVHVCPICGELLLREKKTKQKTYRLDLKTDKWMIICISNRKWILHYQRQHCVPPVSLHGKKNQLTVAICLRCRCSLKWIIVKWIGNARACKLVLGCRLPLSHIAGPGWLVSWTSSTISFLTCQVLSLKVNSLCVCACDEIFCARLSMWLVYSSLTGLHAQKSP